MAKTSTPSAEWLWTRQAARATRWLLTATLLVTGEACGRPGVSMASDVPAAEQSPGARAEGVAGSATYPWVADQGDGTFRNPVIFGDYSDPDVIRVGDDFYLTASSFQCTPGLPILRSRDLVNWTIVGYALANLPVAHYEQVEHGAGVWAPALREHEGTFYIFFPLPDEGIYVLNAAHPAGPWSEPRLLVDGKGLIDPCPLWDDDGQAYLVHAYARSRAGIKDRVRVRPMSSDASRLLGEGQIVFHDPTRHPTLEGPKFYKRNGWYYILAPAGGVARGWQVALRSRNVYGPYEDRVVLEQGSTPINGPHQGALVDTIDGRSWFVHFQDAGIYGRIVHLNSVTWQDDWPLMGVGVPGTNRREPVLQQAKPTAAKLPAGAATITSLPTNDDFDGVRLGLQWQWHANHKDGWYTLSARHGFLRLFPQPLPEGDFARAPHLLLQKLPARSFIVDTVLELQETRGQARAGLIVMGTSHAALTVQEVSGGQEVTLLIDNRPVHREPIASGPVTLFVAMADGGLCRFAFQVGEGSKKTIVQTFQAQAGRWIGAKVGVFAASIGSTGATGHADFAHFTFRAP
jgi:beta-xylosidase